MNLSDHLKNTIATIGIYFGFVSIHQVNAILGLISATIGIAGAAFTLYKSRLLTKLELELKEIEVARQKIELAKEQTPEPPADHETQTLP